MPELSDLIVLGARVTFLVAQNNETGMPMMLGTRPHCAMWWMVENAEQCEAMIGLTNDAGGDSFEERCTREQTHGGSHVVHAGPGLPVLAWLLDPSPASPKSGERDA
jgi:hypothetical protein